LESPSKQQKMYVASVCSEYRSRDSALNSVQNIHSDDPLSCDGCIHWNNSRCKIFDDVLSRIDQT
jgi:hypothetical protein